MFSLFGIFVSFGNFAYFRYFVYFRDCVYFRCEISADSNPIMLLTAILNIGNGADFTSHPQPQLPQGREHHSKTKKYQKIQEKLPQNTKKHKVTNKCKTSSHKIQKSIKSPKSTIGINFTSNPPQLLQEGLQVYLFRTISIMDIFLALSKF